MGICFQADTDLNKTIIRAVSRREPAVDFRSAQTQPVISKAADTMSPLEKAN
jgi:hypothetical protein